MREEGAVNPANERVSGREPRIYAEEKALERSVK
jgi:hypothetical protein